MRVHTEIEVLFQISLFKVKLKKIYIIVILKLKTVLEALLQGKLSLRVHLGSGCVWIWMIKGQNIWIKKEKKYCEEHSVVTDLCIDKNSRPTY